MDFSAVILNTFLVILLVFLNGFFVAAEFAIVKVRSTQIEPLVTKGNWRAIITKQLISHLDTYLSACQLGITMASLGLGWVGEPFAASLLEPIFKKTGVHDQNVIHMISFGVGFSIITFLHVVIGELAPKNLAVRETKKTALWLAYPLRVFFLIFKPIIWLLNSMANWTLRLVGLKTANEAELRHSEEELRLLLAQDDKASTASRDIALRAMDFRKKQGRHIMIPRKEIVALWIGDSLAENVNIMRSHKYSRYPVYAENLDHILGIVHTKDIFKFDKHLDSGFKLESVLRDALFIPETVPIDRILTTMLQKKNHMVLLADEYGSTAGLITLEDVIEELVGAIQDEFDKEKPEVVQVSADEYVIDAALTTNDVERLLGRELSQNDILSIGGLVTEQLGHFPQRGESVEINSIQFIIEQTGERTVDTIRVKRLPIRQINTNE